MEIHETAIIDKKAVIGDNVEIGPYSIIGPGVKIGNNCKIESSVIIKGKTDISSDVFIGPGCNIGTETCFMDSNKNIVKFQGELNIDEGNHFDFNVTLKGRVELKRNNYIGANVTLGLPAQDRGNSEDPVYLKIGENNDIREYVSINCGSHGGSGVTTIGDNNMLMCYAHVGHDCIVGSNCTLANNTTMAGHVELGSFIVTGGFAGFHQFCKIGDYSMIGGMSGIAQDVAPYLLATGARAKIYGINSIGLKRNGFSEDDIKTVKKIFHIFFREMLPTNKALEKMKKEIPQGPVLDRFLNFVEKSDRGILKMI